MSIRRFPFVHAPLDRDVNVRVPKVTFAATPAFGTRTTYACAPGAFW